MRGLDEKIAVITGATSGIGKETALAIAGQNATVVMPVRDIEKGNLVREQIAGSSGNPGIHVMKCDLASFESIHNFADEFKRCFSRLHILVNNAGLWEAKRRETRDGIEMNFGVNHLAPFLLTGLLVDQLKSSAPARVINVSSEAHRFAKMNFDDPEGKKRFCSFMAYGQSKLANILFTRELARRSGEYLITVNCLHPGIVATHLFDGMITVPEPLLRLLFASPRQGAETTIYLVSEPDLNGMTGKYFVRKKPRIPSSAALDDRAAKRLWELSEEYTGMQMR